MPLVRISFMKGRTDGFGEKAGTIVYEAMVETIAVPRNGERVLRQRRCAVRHTGKESP